MQKTIQAILLVAILAMLADCQSQPTCTPRTDVERYLSSHDAESPLPIAPPKNPSSPVEVEINGKKIMVDTVVSGPLCNGRWKGTVYVACDVKVLKWEKDPLFLKGCDLSIEPGTVAYVAHHNDTAYYNGCSCHTGEQPKSNIR